MIYLFKDASSLVSVDLSNFNPENISNIWGMFSGCNSLTSVNLSNLNTKNITNMNSMFVGCDNLNYIDISQFNITDKKTDFFTNLTSNGTIKLSKIFYEEIKELIPENWTKIFSDI